MAMLGMHFKARFGPIFLGEEGEKNVATTKSHMSKNTHSNSLDEKVHLQHTEMFCIPIQGFLKNMFICILTKKLFHPHFQQQQK